jgi:protein SCO1
MPSTLELPDLGQGPPLNRRRLLQGLAATAAIGAGLPALAQTNPAQPEPYRPPIRRDPVTGAPVDQAVSHLPFGRVSPVLPVPNLPVTLDDGKPARLQPLFAGQVTVMQLMFTGCSATCPIQGALFAEVARRNTHREARLVSLSIDALGDTPAALKAWMGRYGAHPSWRAGVPRPEDVETLIGFVRGRAVGPDPHTAKVYFFDRRSQLVYKTYDLPSVRDVLSLIGEAVAIRTPAPR